MCTPRLLLDNQREMEKSGHKRMKPGIRERGWLSEGDAWKRRGRDTRLSTTDPVSCSYKRWLLASFKRTLPSYEIIRIGFIQASAPSCLPIV